MELSRRDFFKLSGAGVGGVFLLKGLRAKSVFASSPKSHPLHKRIGETTTICPYCGVGCSAIMAMEDGKIINIDGDPDHPISEGSLCPKGKSLYQLANNERRLTNVLYRAPGARDWQEKTWDWAIEQIAHRIKQTRDANWVVEDAGERVSQ